MEGVLEAGLILEADGTNIAQWRETAKRVEVREDGYWAQDKTVCAGTTDGDSFRKGFSLSWLSSASYLGWMGS